MHFRGESLTSKVTYDGPVRIGKKNRTVHSTSAPQAESVRFERRLRVCNAVHHAGRRDDNEMLR
jgi:hypothetical protein